MGSRQLLEKLVLSLLPLHLELLRRIGVFAELSGSLRDACLLHPFLFSSSYPMGWTIEDIENLGREESDNEDVEQVVSPDLKAND